MATASPVSFVIKFSGLTLGIIYFLIPMVDSISICFLVFNSFSSISVTISLIEPTLDFDNLFLEFTIASCDTKLNS